MVCGASVPGSTHQQRGLGCDDAYSFAVTGDVVVAAVADGAGSVSGTSAWGAYVACQSVLDDATNPTFIDGFRAATEANAAALVRWLFDGALYRVQRHADTMGLDPALLATTLCVGVAGPEVAVFGQIGDGVIAVESAGRIETLLIEQKQEYANTTTFLQSEGAMTDGFRAAARVGVSAFGLSTDGMSYKITDIATGAAYEPFFRGCWDHVRAGASPSSFARLLAGIEDDQTGDDKTMVLVAAHDGGPADGGAIVTDSSGPPSSTGASYYPGVPVRHDAPPRDHGVSDVATEPIPRTRGRRWRGRRNR